MSEVTDKLHHVPIGDKRDPKYDRNHLSRGSANVDSEGLGVARGNNTGGVLGAIWVDIIVRESVALVVDLILVYDAAVVVGGVDGVVGALAQARLNVTATQEESRANESRAETRNNGVVNSIVTTLEEERPGVAAPDVLSSGLGIASVVAVAV